MANIAAYLSLTALNKRNRAKTKTIMMIWWINSLAMPRRRSHADSRRRSAVAVASRGTIRALGTIRRPSGAVIPIRKNRTPAIHACFLIDSMAPPSRLRLVGSKVTKCLVAYSAPRDRALRRRTAGPIGDGFIDTEDVLESR